MRTYLGLLLAGGAAASSSGADTNARMRALLFGSSCGSDICPGHPDHPDTPKPVVADVAVVDTVDDGAEQAVVSPLSPLAGLFGLDHPEGEDAVGLASRPTFTRGGSGSSGLSLLERIRAQFAQRRGAAPSYGYKKKSCGYGYGCKYPTRKFRRTYGGYVTKGQPQTLGYS